MVINISTYFCQILSYEVIFMVKKKNELFVKGIYIEYWFLSDMNER